MNVLVAVCPWFRHSYNTLLLVLYLQVQGLQSYRLIHNLISCLTMYVAGHKFNVLKVVVD